MAVDAHHLLATGHQPGSHGHASRAGAASVSDVVAAPFPPRLQAWYGREVAGGAVDSRGYLSYMGLVAPPTSATPPGLDRYSEFLALAAVDLAQKGVPFDGVQQLVTNKRKRAEHLPVLDTPDVASQARRQRMEIDRVVLNHAKKMWMGLAEQRRKLIRLVTAAAEAKATSQLRAKDEEIERIRRMNWALEERLRSVYVEAQVWRDLAQSNEAAANVLRGELEQALDTQARRGGGSGIGDDAESCCCGENGVAVRGEEEEVRTPVERRGTGVGRCKGCGVGAAVVLLLPCRHLSVCASCAAAVPACPACGCAKNGTVCVNFS